MFYWCALLVYSMVSLYFWGTQIYKTQEELFLLFYGLLKQTKYLYTIRYGFKLILI